MEAQPQYNINKLVSLSFDESPEVRKQAAQFLGTVDDPAAIFALMELSFDKDTSVRETAQDILDRRKKNEAEVMSFAEMFSAGKKEEKSEKKKTDKSDSKAETKREKVLSPINKLFEKHLGKEKAEAVRKKMMPAIEKIYLKSQKQDDKQGPEEGGRRRAMQEFLTSYLEVISDLESIGGADQEAAVDVPSGKEPVVSSAVAEAQLEAVTHEEPSAEEVSVELEMVGHSELPADVSSQITELEKQEITELREEEGIESLPDTYFKKAYEVMMLSNGDEKLMRAQMQRMLDDAKREIGLAFRMAKKRFKETKITNITDIKDGMRNINTELLRVKDVGTTTYQKTKKTTATMTRVVVNDEAGNEGIIYLPDDRGLPVRPGMRIKIFKGMAKSFPNETALVLGKKGNVYIVL